MDRNFKKAKNVVFALLKFRQRSENEIYQKLRIKKFSQDIIEQTIQYFKDIEFVDDDQFARQWITSRLARPFGLNRIALELKEKGIDQDIIQQQLQKATQNYDEEHVVYELAQRRLLKYKNIDPIKARQRLYGYLNRRGFGFDVIQKVVREIT